MVVGVLCNSGVVEVVEVLVWNADKINRLATIDETSTFPITEHFQHHLKKFPQINFYDAFYYVFKFIIRNFFSVYKVVGPVGKCGCHCRNFSCCLWAVNFVHGQIG